MKICSLSFLILISTLVKLPAQDQENASALIKTLLEEFPEHTEIAVALVRIDSTQYLGFQKNAGEITAISNQSHQFEIGSITKVFTATLLSQLSAQKKLHVNDPINKWLEYSVEGGDSITLHQLANHTAGLPRLPGNLYTGETNPLNPYANYTEEGLRTYLSNDLVLLSGAGEKYAYSNLGAGLLGCILASVAEESFESLIQQNILVPNW